MSSLDQTLEAEVGNAAAHAGETETRASPLSAQSKFLYSFGDLADGMANATLFTYLFFYLTAVCGLSGTLAGVALFISLCIDAVVDPLVGYLSDNTHSKWGRRHPFILGAAIPFALCFGLLFSLPTFESQWALFAYALVMILAVRVGLSFFVLPYASISAEVTTDYTERSVILTYRNFFNIVGQLAAIFLGFGLFFDGENILKHDAYISYGWAGGAIILIGALVSGISSLKLRSRLYSVAPSGPRSLKGLLGEMIDVFKNRSFVLLFLCILVFWFAQAIFLQLGVHAAKYFWGLTTAMIADIQYLTFFGLFCGIFASGLVISRFEKRDISIVGLVIVCLTQLVPTLLAVLGLVPKTEATLYWLLGGIGFLGGIATTCVAVSFGSMMADSADEHEHRFGVRREALYFAGLTFSWKAALAIGGLVAGVALDLIQFPSDIAENPNQVIAPGTLNALALIYGPGAAVISGVSAYVLVTYRLNKTTLTEIQQDLAKRRMKS